MTTKTFKEYIESEIYEELTTLIKALPKDTEMSEVWELYDNLDWDEAEAELLSEGLIITQLDIDLYQLVDNNTEEVVYESDSAENLILMYYDYDLDKFVKPVYEFYSVSLDLANALYEKGELITFDFYDLNIWSRDTDEYSIYDEDVLYEIYLSYKHKKELV